MSALYLPRVAPGPSGTGIDHGGGTGSCSARVGGSRTACSRSRG